MPTAGRKAITGKYPPGRTPRCVKRQLNPWRFRRGTIEVSRISPAPCADHLAARKPRHIDHPVVPPPAEVKISHRPESDGPWRRMATGTMQTGWGENGRR